MKKLVFLSLLSVALLTSCGNGAQKDALKAQNDSLMVELSNRNAELDDIMGAFNEVQEGFRQINEAENRVDLQSGSIRENSADKIKEDIQHQFVITHRFREKARSHIQIRAHRLNAQ